MRRCSTIANAHPRTARPEPGLTQRLETGAELRVTGATASLVAVVCVNGGQAASVPGTWSATLEWLVRRLAPRLPGLRFAEVRYRVKSWNRLGECIDDAQAAIEAVAAERILLVGFSMGGAVSVACAGDPRVAAVLGLAPWIPDRLSVEPLRGKRLRVLHGSLDRALPGIPGVSPASARHAFERARAIGVEGELTVIPGGLHGLALRARNGVLVPLPRARRFAAFAEQEIRRL
jgi:pimeloyl-ACP methyl ester carboxylesterase